MVMLAVAKGDRRVPLVLMDWEPMAVPEELASELPAVAAVVERAATAPAVMAVALAL